MWMMGCSSDSSSLTVSDSCNPRKLRPIVPKPHIYPTARAVSSSSWLSLSNEEEPISVFHSLTGEEQRRRELGTQVSSRWNPTPDQLRILDDLYKRGTRTPTAVQIQCITAQLRCYGKIEGKNVFYWFQNHKARERQKRRRRIEAATELVDCYLGRKDSGSASCWIDFEQSKEWVSPQWRIRPEEPILSYGEERAEKPSQGSWKTSLQFKGDNITCQQNPNIKTPDLNFPEISTPPTTPINKDPGETSTIETLQLFPLHNNANSTSTTTNNTTTVPTSHQSHKNIIQYFQFLPLKN